MENNFQEKVKDALEFDTIRTAEILGAELGLDKNQTDTFGLLLHINKSKRTEALLKENCDSYFGQTPQYFLNLLHELKFKKVYEEKFRSYDNVDEIYYIFYHDDGLLLDFETYHSNRINSADFFFNWQPKREEYHSPSGVSGGWIEGHVFIGSKDVREGLRLSLDEMRTDGKFLNPWREMPHISLTTFKIGMI
jgi:hypothetical protein